jgi:hypothetical protein
MKEYKNRQSWPVFFMAFFLNLGLPAGIVLTIKNNGSFLGKEGTPSLRVNAHHAPGMTILKT